MQRIFIALIAAVVALAVLPFHGQEVCAAEKTKLTRRPIGPPMA